MSANDIQSRLNECGTRREKANELFRTSKFSEALSEYKDIAAVVDSIITSNSLDSSSELMQQCMIAKIPCELNGILCLLNLEKYQEASALADTVLGYDTIHFKRVQHAKLLYRKGVAEEKLGHREAALRFYETAAKIDPQDSTIKSAYNRLKVSPEDVQELEEFLSTGKMPSFAKTPSNSEMNQRFPNLQEALEKSGLKMTNFGMNLGA